MYPKKIALLTDSCADISRELAAKHHIYIVPLRILCSDGEYQDGVNIFNQDIYRYLQAGELPQTSLPATEDMAKVIKRIVADGFDGILAVMMSSGLSGTYNLARLAAEECDEYITMKAFDSRSASLGQGMILLQLAKDIENGMSWEELVERRVPQLIENTHAFFSVDTLEYLQKGGRIGKVTATAGTLLQIKPVLSFAEDGQLTSVAKVRGRKQVMQKLIELTAAHGEGHARYNLAVANGGAPEEMAVLRTMHEAALPNYADSWEGEIDGTLSVYIGNGILGAAIQLLDE